MAPLLLLLLPMADVDETTNWAPPPTAAEQQAAAKLLEAAERGDGVRNAAAAALEWIGEDNPSASAVKEARESGTTDDAKRAAESLQFRPAVEAPLAVGYPPPSRLHAIEVKRLPAYRMVRVAMNQNAAAADESGQRGETGAFWSLFGHIQKEGIAMTAPVRTDYDRENDHASTMACLYRKPTMGQLGADGLLPGVEVVDVPAHDVVSIGVRDRSEQTVTEARKRLELWLDQQPEQTWVVDGPLKVLGYNGPQTPRDRRIVEVQLPVRRADAASTE